MSAFAVVFERSNTSVDPGVLERVMERLKHRGPDGRDVFLGEHFAMGHWHFWTTPEEVGERQPFKLGGLPFRIVLDGRLDNRSDLISELELLVSESNQLSDAALILYAYDRWGEHCFEHFIGPFAFTILDERDGLLLCGRDALGDRTLFYSWKGTCLVLASEPWAVAGADGSMEELDDMAAAHYFALRAVESGQTLFKNVNELLPAQVMLVNAFGERKWKYWKPVVPRQVEFKTDEEYAQKFLALLEESVRSRVRATTPVGILMSGGLDSTSVACLAARMLKPEPLTTISYVYDELPDCDERQYINTVKEKWGIRSIQIPCDDAWPLKDWQIWPFNPNEPDGYPFRLLLERAHHRASEQGLRVLLTGAFGDHLYGAGDYWLADLITDARYLNAVQELSLYIRYEGFRWTLHTDFLRHAVRVLINKLSGGKRMHRRAWPIWLTQVSIDTLSDTSIDSDAVLGRYGILLGLMTALSCSSGSYYNSRNEIELRHPFRDRRLVEYVLTLPTNQLYYRGLYKYILRNAMRDILPDTIRTRQQPTSVASLFYRGVEREETIFQAFLQDPGAKWRKFVRADWISNNWNTLIASKAQGPEMPITWMCIAFEKWYNFFMSH